MDVALGTLAYMDFNLTRVRYRGFDCGRCVYRRLRVEQIMELSSVMQLTQNNGAKCLVYGASGAGKTRLIATAPQPIILAAEKGLLSLRSVILEMGIDIPVLVLNCWNDVLEAYNMLLQQNYMEAFQTVCVDSLSEIAEMLLAEQLPLHKDPRKAYGEMQIRTMQFTKMLIGLQHYKVYVTAKQGRIQDEGGAVLLGPMFPGQQLAQKMPYEFDEIFHLYVGTDDKSQKFRALRTEKDNRVEAKDRSGKLAELEYPDLNHIFNKIIN